MKVDLVYEIGTEEIPAGYLPPAVEQLRKEFAAFLAEHVLAADSVETHATPRRLVLFAKGLPERQEDRSEEVTGPPWRAAFDGDGRPTKAAEGFARGRGISVDDLQQVETPKGPYVGATILVKGRTTRELLADVLPELTARLVFPKTMRWGPERFRFARPIRWLLALLGEEVVPVAIEGVRTGRVTYGHRILAPGPFEVAAAGDYEAALEQGLVVLSAAERKTRIEKLLQEAAVEAGGTVVPDPRLVEEVCYLVEMPSVLASSFDEEFLGLPAPVIITAMRDHQRYFAVADSDGKLLPRFLCVTNSAPAAAAQVRDGNQRVLRARLDDARFYWNEDLKSTLEEKVPTLGNVVWLEGFGSLEDKTHRLCVLAAELTAEHAPEATETARRAALLAKTDLVTEMIKDGKEFTSLQGVIGREYATQGGEPAEVALAIEEQYLPRFAGDALPQSAAGSFLALADRVDTLVGVWAAGLKPTGNKDPFALRRSALGIIRILLERGLDLRVGSLIRRAAELYGELLSDRDGVVTEAAAFVRDRLRGFFVDEGFAADVAAAVIPVSGGNPVDARARVEALTSFRTARPDEFEALAAGFKRAKNILKKDSAEGEPTEATLSEEPEKALYEAYRAVEKQVAEAERGRRYEEALTGLARLRAPIDDFFDGVMVLVDDETVRRNRLRLLGCIVEKVQGLADLSRISPPEGKTE